MPAPRSPLLVAAVAAVLLCAFMLGGVLPPAYGVAGLAAVAAAALLTPGPRAAPPPVVPPPSAAGAATTAAAATVEAVVAAAPIPLILLAPDGTVVAFSAGARTLAPALRRGEAAVLALRDPDVVEAIREVGAGGFARRVEISQRVPLDRWYAIHVDPVPFTSAPAAPAGRGAHGLLLTVNDLTPLRRVEEMRADFVANASHELRTPLAALSGFIDTLQGAARDDAAARERFLRIMREQARRMARLIDDLLSLSRIELNAHIQPAARVALAPLVRGVIDGLQMLAQERKVSVEMVDAPAPVVVRGDRDELVRVFENLIENALKYGSAGGRVVVTLSGAPAPGGEASAAVRDFGPGIAAEHLPRLTERFYRVDAAHSRAEGGTGLGLALVKHILNRHRGRLTIASKVGEGATFTVRLPAAPDAGTDAACEQEMPAKSTP